MADSSAAPGGYYSGPPAAPHDKHKAAPPSKLEPEPVDGQVNASVPGYYNGGPAAKRGGQGSAAPSKESGFFANCCACFSGGQTAR